MSRAIVKPSVGLLVCGGLKKYSLPHKHLNCQCVLLESLAARRHESGDGVGGLVHSKSVLRWTTMASSKHL